jgi:hypothetical protein
LRVRRQPVGGLNPFICCSATADYYFDDEDDDNININININIMQRIFSITVDDQ